MLWLIGFIMSFFSTFVYYWRVEPAWFLFLIFFSIYTALMLSPTKRFPALEGEDAFRDEALYLSYPQLITDSEGKHVPDPHENPDMYNIAPFANPGAFEVSYPTRQCPLETVHLYQACAAPVSVNLTEHWDDLYCPAIPDQTPDSFRQEFIDAYKLFSEPVKPNTELLPGQKAETGGENALPPKQLLENNTSATQVRRKKKKQQQQPTPLRKDQKHSITQAESQA